MRIDISLPKDISIKNISNEIISFGYFGVNFNKKLDIDEEVIISGASSEATAYYLAQADENKALQVTITDSNSTEETPNEEPVVEEPTEPTEPVVEEQPKNSEENSEETN